MLRRSKPARSKSTSKSPERIDIAIVGGGIAGLYCAWELEKSSKAAIRVYEGSDTLGGRILTRRYPDSEYGKATTEFIAEFGPMRIEPDQQPLLKALLTDLHIEEQEKAKNKSLPCLIDFPPYSSPRGEIEPTYPLSGDENDQKTPLDLMKLAFVRILGRLVVRSFEDQDKKQRRIIEAHRDHLRECLKKGHNALMLAAASRQPGWQGAFDRWINDLTEDDYQDIREYAEFEYDGDNRVPLWNMGFWNLLSDVLSHNAVIRLRDMGTFYHLISENPNAAEWLIFWLRALKSSEKLKGVDQGMDSITKLIRKKIKSEVEINYKLMSVRPYEGDKVLLKFANNMEVIARHVILALPKAPLRKIASASNEHFPIEIAEQLEAVYGFPMVKIFFIVKRRWWEEDYRANTFATRMPTRELHYWKSDDPKSKKGMIMLYTDRPGSAFWANYVGNPGSQSVPEWEAVSTTTKLKNITSVASSSQKKRLIFKLLQYMRDIGVDSIRESDIEYCGIRDWGRDPYVGANHAWRPERKSWEVLANVSAFELNGGTVSNVHICGEAYSDYHGFIEGSLRSAAHVLHRIAPSYKTQSPWLCRNEPCQCYTKSAAISS